MKQNEGKNINPDKRKLREYAAELFIVEGKPISEIIPLLEGRVSEKIIYVWMQKDKWKTKRNRFLAKESENPIKSQMDMLNKAFELDPGQRASKNLNGFRVLARKLYVIRGLELKEIVIFMGGKVTLKTLYNWMTRDKWKQIRDRKIESSERLIFMVEKLLESTLKRAGEDPNESNLKNIEIAQKRYEDIARITESIDINMISEFIPKIEFIKRPMLDVTEMEIKEFEGREYFSIMEYARRACLVNWKRVYNRINSKASNGKYLTYRVENHTAYIAIDDPEILSEGIIYERQV